MTEHTPGPWGFGNTHEGQRLILGDNGEGGYVCNVQIHQTPRHMGQMDEEEREANARLIAAAPEMLEALKKVVDAWGDYCPKGGKAAQILHDAQDLINKAEGK